jgi:chorismate mutase
MMRVVSGVSRLITKTVKSLPYTRNILDVLATRQRLKNDLAVYKHAFETTAADRDRLQNDLATYKHAFETTAADRDRLASADKFAHSDRLNVLKGGAAGHGYGEVIKQASLKNEHSDDATFEHLYFDFLAEPDVDRIRRTIYKDVWLSET